MVEINRKTIKETSYNPTDLDNMGKILKSLKKTYINKPSEDFIKKQDSWTSIIFSDPFSIPLARFLARFKKITPNHVSLLTIPFAVIIAYFFFKGQFLYGAFFFLIKFIIDGTDGKLARLTNNKTKFGERLDYFTDIVNNIPIYFGLWYNLYYLNNDWFIGGAIIIIHYLTMAFGYIFLKKLTYHTIFPRLYSYYIHIDEGFLTFFFAPILETYIIGSFYIVFPALVILQFFSYFTLFIIQKEKPDVKNNIKKMLKI